MTPDAMLFLASKGLSVEDIAEFLRLDGPKSEEKTRSSAAERQARYRAKRNGDVTRDVTPSITRDVTEASLSVTRDAPSCVRDKDINLTSVDRPNLTTLQCVSERADADGIDWPPPEPAHGPYLDRLAAALRKAGGPALSAISPNLISLAPILALGRAGKGAPCDLYADILPVIAARSSRSKPNSISTWGYFTEAIREARDQRLAGAPAHQKITSHGQGGRNVRPDADPKFDRHQANLDRAFAGSEGAIRRRAVQSEGGF